MRNVVTFVEGEKMKIQGLKSEDFEHIERAFSYTIGEQLLMARRKAQEGNMEGCEVFLDAARDMIATFKKIQKAESGYMEKSRRADG